jgi:hypothetical protein
VAASRRPTVCECGTRLPCARCDFLDAPGTVGEGAIIEALRDARFLTLKQLAVWISRSERNTLRQLRKLVNRGRVEGIPSNSNEYTPCELVYRLRDTP